jgi:simple sugar transport system permease protein
MKRPGWGADAFRVGWALENGVLVGLFVVVFGVMWVLNPGRFVTGSNLQTMAFQFPELGLLALGMMVALVSGGINLAVVAMSNLAGIAAALVLVAWMPESSGGHAGWLVTVVALVAGLSAGLAAGTATGFLVGWLRVTPILATLGMMMMLEGLNLVLTRGRAISGLPETLRFLGNGTVWGIPVPLIVFGLSALALSVTLNRTVYGRGLYMMGANPVGARFSGVDNRRVLVSTYMWSGVLAGLAGLIMISRFNSAKAGYGQSYLLVTLLAAVLGGTRATGGFGRVSGLIFALLMLQTVASGLNLMRVNAYYTNALWGGLLLAAMFLKRWIGSLTCEKRR